MITNYSSDNIYLQHTSSFHDALSLQLIAEVTWSFFIVADTYILFTISLTYVLFRVHVTKNSKRIYKTKEDFDTEKDITLIFKTLKLWRRKLGLRDGLCVFVGLQTPVEFMKTFQRTVHHW